MIDKQKTKKILLASSLGNPEDGVSRLPQH